MSGISSGVGLISGINTAQLIEQLMAIEARPVTMLQTRGKTIDAQRAAFLSISAQVLAVQNAAKQFKNISFFRKFTSKSSDETVINAVAGQSAVVGSTTFRVHSLVSSHVLASRGFVDADRTPIGVGRITIEGSAARVDRSTDLDELNGGRGVRRGTIAITDRSGATADIDLSMAFTVSDVLDAINSNGTVRVRAYVTGIASNGAQGNRIVIEDVSGGSGNLTVADKHGGFSAVDLGIAASVSGTRIDGADVYRLTVDTPLSALNDGNGVDRLHQGTGISDLTFRTSQGHFEVLLSDAMNAMTSIQSLNQGLGVRLGVIRITDRTGASAEVDLTQATTVGEIHEALSTTGLNISVTYANSRFVISETTAPPPATNVPVDPDTPAPVLKPLKIEDVTGHAAADLGLAKEVDGARIEGSEVYRMRTVGDLIRAINTSIGNNGLVEASVSADGSGITLRALGEGNAVEIITGRDTQGRVSGAAEDLGLLGATFTSAQAFQTRALVGGINTVLLKSLRGGTGVTAGVVAITDGAGRSAQVDFSAARTLQDVIDILNAQSSLGLRASVNRFGNGILFRDESAGGGAVTIADVSGNLAASLGVSGAFGSGATDAIAGTNLQRKYISRQTTLASLNGGAGIQPGTIRISDAFGGIYDIRFDDSHRTLGQMIDHINERTPDTLEARINDTGDGILIIDRSTGANRVTIEDRNGGTMAAGLRIAGTAKAGQGMIDGSFELAIDVNASDTLSVLASKLNGLKSGFSAAVLNDGGATNPFSLAITSRTSGRKGELIVDTGGLDLGFSTITRARDAIVSVGQSGAAAMLVTHSSNTMTNVIPGVTVNLLSANAREVTVTTDQDIESMVTALQAFTDAYNQAQDAMDKAIAFNSETNVRGPLMGDATVSFVRNRMQAAVNRAFADVDPRVSRLSAVGIRQTANNRIEFQAEKFREVYAASPELVEELFTKEETGFGVRLGKSLEEITRSFDGLLARKDQALSSQKEVITDRINSLNVLLEAKRRRMQNQFTGLESALAALQGQQTSLNELAVLASSLR